MATELPGTPDPSAVAYWRERFTGLPPGPVPAGGADRRRTRHSGVLTGWRRMRAAVESRGLTPDAALLAVLTEALRPAWTATSPCWPPAGTRTRPRRPGEHTG